MVFKAKGRTYFKTRVRTVDGRSKVCGCDTDDRGTAARMEAWTRQLYTDRTPIAVATLDAIVAGRIALPRAYDQRGDLGALVTGLSDVDLEPFVAKWQKELARRNRPNAETRAKYLTQVRTFIPAGVPCWRSQFTKTRIREWLEGLGVGQPNRHRSALSSFAQFLALEDVLPGNPVRLVPMAKENDPRTLHLVMLDAKKLIRTIDNPKLRAFHAAMLAGAMEHAAARRLDTATITDSSAFADGMKTTTRQRTVTVYSRWAWAWAVVRTYVATLPDGAKPFEEVSYASSAWALNKALRKAGLDPNYTQHDHRHTWAVQALRDGIEDQAVAHQLGHKDAAMVHRVYGKYVPTKADIRVKTVTRGVTPSRNDVKPARVK